MSNKLVVWKPQPQQSSKALIVSKPRYKYKKPFVSKKTATKPYISRSPYGNGWSKFVALKYTSTYEMATANPATQNVFAGQQSFRLNSITLPFVGQASGNALPQGLTSLINVYSQYKVYAVGVKIEFFDPEGDDVRVGVKIDSSRDGQELNGTLIDQAQMKYGTFIRSVPLTGSQKAYVSFYKTIRSIEGLSKAEFAGDVASYSGVITQSVATATADEITATAGRLVKRRPLLHMAVASTSTTLATVKYRMTLIYYTKVYGRISLPFGQSAV